MTAVLTIMAKQRGDVSFVHQSLYYPVTNAAQDTESYREFADGPYLTAKAMAGSGTATPVTRSWKGCRPRSSSRTRATCSGTRARHTPAR